jgi:hypothetical protein
MELRMSFKQLADETLTEAWERYRGFMTDLPTAGMEDWEFNQGFYCGLPLLEEPSSCSTLKKCELFSRRVWFKGKFLHR